MTITTKKMTAQSDVVSLFKTVVDGGYCVGCGGCAAVKGSPVRIELTRHGMYQAAIDPGVEDQTDGASLQAVCPFSDEAPNENEIARDLFGDDCDFHDKIGYHRAVYAGHVVEGDFRASGSSGGMTNWLAVELLKLGRVDGVIHVGEQPGSENGKTLYGYRVSTTLEDVIAGSKSRYYPVEISRVMNEIRGTSGRFVFVGVPSLVKAVRLLARQDPDIDDRIAYCLALVCGQMKSTRFADMLGWQAGIRPGNLTSIDFRRKLEGQPADKFGVEMTAVQDGQSILKLEKNHDLFQDPWGLGFFKYKACDFCDDIVGETADVSLGDAWIPRYSQDSKGANEVIVRNVEIQQIMERAADEGRLVLDQLDIEELVESQGGAFRHRRDGLGYRLLETDKSGEWRPRKRVAASDDHLSPRLKFIHKMRVKMARTSHGAFDDAIGSGQMSDFSSKMDPLVRKYNGPAWRKIASHTKARVFKLLSMVGAGR